jgi:hypothetical protein
VLRAAWNVIKDDPDWEAWRIQGMGSGYVFMNCANVESYTLGRLLCDEIRIIYRSEKRARRRPGEWVRVGCGHRQKRPVYWERDFVSDRAQLLAYNPGNWRRIAETHVAHHIAYRDADPATRETMAAQWRAEAWSELGKCFEAADVTGKETVTEIIPPSDLSPIAQRLRTLITQNDPDVVRTELHKIADTLDRLAAP